MSSNHFGTIPHVLLIYIPRLSLHISLNLVICTISLCTMRCPLVLVHEVGFSFRSEVDDMVKGLGTLYVQIIQTREFT